MSQALRSMMNPIMKALLRSPLHVLVSGWCMLITVTGRKTGNHYTIPVYYRQEENMLRFFSGRTLRWVTNLTGGAAVKVRLRGKDFTATAQPNDDRELTCHWLRVMYPRMAPENTAQLVLIEVRL